MYLQKSLDTCFAFLSFVQVKGCSSSTAGCRNEALELRAYKCLGFRA